MNSGNYIGFRTKISGPKDLGYYNDALLTNIHWGLQRAMGERWLLNTHVGLGYGWNLSHDFSVGSPYPSIDFKISYVILKKESTPWKSKRN